MPRLSTLKPQHIQICDNTLRSRGMIAPNKAIIAAIAMTSPTLVRCLVSYYSAGTGTGTLDTYERDYLMDAVAETYCRMPWPCNMDGDAAMEQFTDSLLEHASQAGWVFTETA